LSEPLPQLATAWRPCSPDRALVARLAAELNLQPVVAAALVARGVSSPDEGRCFLDPSIDDLLDPFALADMDKAAERIARALSDDEPVLVYGDYDVDGLTSTALFMHFLRYLGADPHVYVPNRATEGYSFTEGGVSTILASGARVVVSVDNGISSVAPVDELRQAGIDVIITDHHLPPDELPPAYAIVNPRRQDCEYPYKGLAGVGVAFKVACAVAAKLSEGRRRSPEMMRFLGEAMAWVALGTIADMVPLTGENRILAARGLRAIPLSTSPGLAALCGVAGVRPADFTEDDVAFKLAPRLNAAGRMGQSDLALALLIAPDEKAAGPIARQLDALNNRRRQADRELLLVVQERMARQPTDGPVVLHDDRWATGLLGLVAGRVAQQTGRPAVLISGAHGDPAKGSCRSVPGFDVHAALAQCSEHLESHGGHAAAAGFTIRGDRIAGFREAFVAAWHRQNENGHPTRVIEYDGELPLSALTPRLMQQLERLAPFGQGNQRPVLGAQGVTIREARRMGDGSHLQMQVSDDSAVLRAVAFGRGDLADLLGDGSRVDLLFRPRRNTWRGRSSIELELVDLRPAASATPAAEDAP
jgi:single-stranded-DNA-specific exonuclease